LSLEPLAEGLLAICMAIKPFSAIKLIKDTTVLVVGLYKTSLQKPFVVGEPLSPNEEKTSRAHRLESQAPE